MTLLLIGLLAIPAIGLTILVWAACRAAAIGDDRLDRWLDGMADIEQQRHGGRRR